MLRDILNGDPQVEAWLEVVRAASPDVLVIGDFDYDLYGVALGALAERLGAYPHRFSRRPNRGRDSGRDLNRNGRYGEAEDAEGYGTFAGQGGMAVLSRYPILSEDMRDFSDVPWSGVPDALTVGDGGDPTRLSTTVHWELPVQVAPGNVLRLLIWHGTAPVFDGPKDRNGRRNHDETRFWQLYIDGDIGEAPAQPFVVVGTANADPADGESRKEAIRDLLAHPRLQDPQPMSRGGEDAALRDGGVNARHRGAARLDTVDWPDGPGDPGNLRVDYILPSSDQRVAGSGVFWPVADDSISEAVALASRHRLIWVDIERGDRLADGR